MYLLCRHYLADSPQCKTSQGVPAVLRVYSESTDLQCYTVAIQSVTVYVGLRLHRLDQ